MTKTIYSLKISNDNKTKKYEGRLVDIIYYLTKENILDVKRIENNMSMPFWGQADENLKYTRGYIDTKPSDNTLIMLVNGFTTGVKKWEVLA